MPIPCKQILIAILLGMFTFTVPVAADEPDEYLKLKIRSYPDNALEFALWREMLHYSYGYNPNYGTYADFEDMRDLKNVSDQRFEAIAPKIYRTGGKVSNPTAESIEDLRVRGLAVVHELVEEFGEKKFLRAVQIDNMRFVISKARQRKIIDPSLLTVPEFRDKLNLTREQRRDLGEIELEYKEKLSLGLEDFYVTIRDLNREKLSLIESELSPEQNRLAKQLIGQPLNWARLISSNEEHELRRMIGEHSGKAIDSGVGRVILPEGCDIDVIHFRKSELPVDYDEAELEWPHFDSMLDMLISSEFAAAEMEISDDQRAKLKKFITEVRKTSIISGKFAKERLRSLLDGSAKLPAELTEILVPMQLDWIRQAELQFFTAEHRSTFGLTYPIMVRRLELSNAKVNKIEEIASKFNEPIAESVSAAETELAKISMEFGQKRIDVLEQEDRKRFQLLTGIDCDQLELMMDAIVRQPANAKRSLRINPVRN